jgi:hypothetical protein
MQGNVAFVVSSEYPPVASVVVDETVPLAQTASTVPPLIAAPVAAVPLSAVTVGVEEAVPPPPPPPPPQADKNSVQVKKAQAVIFSIVISYKNISDHLKLIYWINNIHTGYVL